LAATYKQMSDQRIHQSIQNDPENFKGFSKLVRNNKKYAIRAIRLDEENILHIGKNLDTTEFMKECISSNTRVLYARPDLISNKEIIKYCLSKFKPSLFINFFKLEALEDYEIALYAVKFSGEYADQTLLDDLSFIFECIKGSPFSIQYVPEHLTSDVNFLKKSIQLNWNVFQFINEKTEELIITSIHENIECIKFIPSSFFKNKKIIKLCLEKDGLTHMKEIANVTEDRDLVLKILKEDSLYFKEMPRKFKSDKEIILKSGKKNKIIYNFVPKIMIRNDVEIEWKSKGYWKLISEMDKNRDIHFNFSYCF
jgi:hypothetical protein